MPKRTDIHKILVIGSGPIVIGQAAEFDYAGTQACLALKEEGYQVVLCNSNPATIMTDTSIADKVYMEPLTLEYIARIIRRERPDAILPGIGGQTGLNLAMLLEKKGVLRECQVELLGTKSRSIEQAEDRELFKELCTALGEPVLPSDVADSVESGLRIAEKIGYPVVLRPAFTLGGTGGGFAENETEFLELIKNALTLSPVHQVLIEKSIKGYKEIEYEVMRDHNDTAITICNMENLDPVGIHTGGDDRVSGSVVNDTTRRTVNRIDRIGGNQQFVEFAVEGQLIVTVEVHLVTETELQVGGQEVTTQRSERVGHFVTHVRNAETGTQRAVLKSLDIEILLVEEGDVSGTGQTRLRLFAALRLEVAGERGEFAALKLLLKAVCCRDIGGRKIFSGSLCAPFKCCYGIYDVKENCFYDLDELSDNYSKYAGLIETLETLEIGKPTGDANLDNTVSISDVTCIQRMLAEYDQFTKYQNGLSDVNKDSKVNIADATDIQRYSAQLITDFDR